MEQEDVEKIQKAEENNKPTCPECGSEELIIVSHCVTCPVCGFSLCSL